QRDLPGWSPDGRRSARILIERSAPERGTLVRALRVGAVDLPHRPGGWDVDRPPRLVGVRGPPDLSGRRPGRWTRARTRRREDERNGHRREPDDADVALDPADRVSRPEVVLGDRDEEVARSMP